jgi:hypothetical protein
MALLLAGRRAVAQPNGQCRVAWVSMDKVDANLPVIGVFRAVRAELG